MKLPALLISCALALPIVMSAAPAESPESISPLEVGEMAPDITVKTSTGESFDLGTAVKGRLTAVIFYRGGWCPYCNRHLAALQEVEEALKTLGYQILAISPDRPEALQPTTDKNDLSYELLSDRGMIAASAYGVAFRMSDKVLARYKEWGFDLAPVPGEPDARWLPVPAVFLIDAEGVVRFVHTNPNYKERIDPTELVKVATEIAQ